MSTRIKQRGFTVIELLMYAVGMVIILAAIVSLLYYLYDWYRFATIPTRADRVGISLVDRIVKDVRIGQSIDLSGSSFNVPTGSLLLNTKVNGADITKYFSVENERVTYQENGSSSLYLSPVSVTVSRFYFTQIVTPLSQAIRIEIDITYATRDGPKTRNYRGVAILRNSYE